MKNYLKKVWKQGAGLIPFIFIGIVFLACWFSAEGLEVFNCLALLLAFLIVGAITLGYYLIKWVRSARERNQEDQTEK